MSLRSSISPWVSASMTSPVSRNARRRAIERARRRRGWPHEIGYFHQVDDPYSALVSQRLDDLLKRYDVRLVPHLVPPPPDWAAPERERLRVYALRDAKTVASAFGVASAVAVESDPASTRRAQSILAAALSRPDFASTARDVHLALAKRDRDGLERLADQRGDVDDAALQRTLAQGAKTREAQGHYLGATFFYGEEWYWGLDRLADLESRLRALGADRSPTEPDLAARRDLELKPLPPGRDLPPLEFFLSLRSPYTYLAAERVSALAAHYGLELRLRFVLPMVMRGLPVHASKRLYIMRDTKREAERLDLPFGRVSDPVGKPVERGLAVLSGAIEHGKGEAFAQSFLKGVFAEGIDAGSDRGLRRLCHRAGIDWSDAKSWMRDDGWRAVAEQNRSDMFAESLWGVPSFRFGAVSAWGQDRLWLIEDAIVGAIEASVGMT